MTPIPAMRITTPAGLGPTYRPAGNPKLKVTLTVRIIVPGPAWGNCSISKLTCDQPPKAGNNGYTSRGFV